jgi:hypothetical protein
MILRAIVLLGLSLALASCEDPDARVSVGNRDYRTLPPGDATSWPSSGTSNGAGCAAAPGKHVLC